MVQSILSNRSHPARPSFWGEVETTYLATPVTQQSWRPLKCPRGSWPCALFSKIALFSKVALGTSTYSHLPPEILHHSNCSTAVFPPPLLLSPFILLLLLTPFTVELCPNSTIFKTIFHPSHPSHPSHDVTRRHPHPPPTHPTHPR